MTAEYSMERYATARYAVKEAREAKWARRIAVFFLQLLILTVLLHRFAGLGTAAAINLILVSSVGMAIAVIIAIVSLVRIWFGGQTGAANDFAAIAVGLVAIHAAMTEDIRAAGGDDEQASRERESAEIGGDRDGDSATLQAQGRSREQAGVSTAGEPEPGGSDDDASAGTRGESGVISVDQVKRIHSICADLLQRFYTSSDSITSASLTDSRAAISDSLMCTATS